VDVPRRVFKGRECRIDEDEAARFTAIVQARYPWLTRNSVDVLLKKARMEMLRVRDEETKGKEYSMTLAAEGRLEEAIEHMRIHLDLDPEDADSWYALGDLLCKNGQAAEGYKAYHRGMDLATKGKRKRRCGA
jgi:tetratricopeptide (TPR) repeat protein